MVGRDFGHSIKLYAADALGVSTLIRQWYPLRSRESGHNGFMPSAGYANTNQIGLL